MIRLRAFRNGDPPALATLWNRALPDREVVRPLRAHEFDELVLGRLQFEADGLIIAEDEGNPVGFAHASFGPRTASGPSHQIDRELGSIAMLIVDPKHDDPTLERSLFAEAERYLRRRGAKVFYAGGQAELSSSYWGLYGGSECSGVLDNHLAFRRAAETSGYESVAQTILFDLDLGLAETRDPRSHLIRRQVHVEVTEDAMPATWWESTAIGHTPITRFRLLAKRDGRELARAKTWDMVAFSRLDGKARTGLIDVEVAEGERRKGYGRFLITEILRQSRGQWAEFASVQTRATNRAAVALYESVGFRRINSSTLYRRPGSRLG